MNERLKEIKELFFGEGYTVSDQLGIGEWIEDTHFLIETIEQQQEEIERYKKAMDTAINCINHEAFRTACNELEEALEGNPNA